MKIVGFAGLLLSFCLHAPGQAIPDVTCPVEDLPVKAVVAWQFPQIQKQVQVAVLRDPATPRFLEPNTGLRGVTTLTVAQRAQLGEDAAAKKKALRYIKAVKSVREVPPPMGASFARGTQLWEIVA